MDILLSISAWCNFILSRLLLDAIFIVIAILAVFALFNRKEYRNNSELRFIITAVIVTLIIRYTHFVLVDGKINSRHLLPVAFYMIILCVPGFFAVIRLADYLLKFTPVKKRKFLKILLFAGISIACIWKALHPPRIKYYIHNVATIIKESENSERPVLISDLDDIRRVAWHSNADFIMLDDVMNIDNLVNFPLAVKSLSSKEREFYLLLNFKDSDLRAKLNNEKIIFPEELILLKELKVKRRRFYSLYKIRKTD